MKYVSPKQFARISKGKEVKSFPNPACKQIGEIMYEIIDNPTCTSKMIEVEHYPWYLGTTREEFAKTYGEDEVYFLTVVDGYFPTDLVAGTKKWGCYRRYSMGTALSNKTGWLSGTNRGTATEAFLSSKVNEAIRILRKHGFMFDFIQK